MAPSDLEFIFHCNCSPSVHPHIATSAIRVTVRRFLAEDIIEAGGTDGVYALTERGQAWLKCILKTPYPKKVWLDSEGNTI